MKKEWIFSYGTLQDPDIQKELIKILEQIDSERSKQNLREYSAAKKEQDD